MQTTIINNNYQYPANTNCGNGNMMNQMSQMMSGMMGMFQNSQPTYNFATSNPYNMTQANPLYSTVSSMYSLIGKYQTNSFSLANSNPFGNSYNPYNMFGTGTSSNIYNMYNTGNPYITNTASNNGLDLFSMFGSMFGNTGSSSSNGIADMFSSFLSMFGLSTGTTSNTNTIESYLEQFMEMFSGSNNSTSNDTSDSFGDYLSTLIALMNNSTETSSDPLFSINENNNGYISTFELKNYMLENFEVKDNMNTNILNSALNAYVDTISTNEDNKISLSEFEAHLDQDEDGVIESGEIDKFNETMQTNVTTMNNKNEFVKINKDENEIITNTELKTYLTENFGLSASANETTLNTTLNQLISTISKDNNSEITFSEFTTYIDTNKNGIISTAELDVWNETLQDKTDIVNA